MWTHKNLKIEATSPYNLSSLTVYFFFSIFDFHFACVVFLNLK